MRAGGEEGGGPVSGSLPASSSSPPKRTTSPPCFQNQRLHLPFTFLATTKLSHFNTSTPSFLALPSRFVSDCFPHLSSLPPFQSFSCTRPSPPADTDTCHCTLQLQCCSFCFVQTKTHSIADAKQSTPLVCTPALNNVHLNTS